MLAQSARTATSHRYPATQHWLVPLALALAVAQLACSINTGQPIPTYDHVPGHIVVQLYAGPGLLFPPITGEPDWTLYGDGTLITRAGLPSSQNPSGLLAAQISQSDVQIILETIVNQDDFFASTRTSYGTAALDAGVTLLTVVANGQRKQVAVQVEAGPNPDQQTSNVFAIVRYLRTYRPPGPTAPYGAPGIALLATDQGAAGSPQATPWPFGTISLADVAARSCPYLPVPQTCAAPADGHPGLRAVYGTASHDVLSFIAGLSNTLVTQHGVVYNVRAYPLLPDALRPAAGTAPAIVVFTSGGLRAAPLDPAPPG